MCSPAASPDSVSGLEQGCAAAPSTEHTNDPVGSDRAHTTRALRDVVCAAGALTIVGIGMTGALIVNARPPASLTTPSKRTVRSRSWCAPGALLKRMKSSGQRQNASPSMLHSVTPSSNGAMCTTARSSPSAVETMVSTPCRAVPPLGAASVRQRVAVVATSSTHPSGATERTVALCTRSVRPVRTSGDAHACQAPSSTRHSKRASARVEWKRNSAERVASTPVGAASHTAAPGSPPAPASRATGGAAPSQRPPRHERPARARGQRRQPEEPGARLVERHFRPTRRGFA